jgi:hypothetical protein
MKKRPDYSMTYVKGFEVHTEVKKGIDFKVLYLV